MSYLNKHEIHIEIFDQIVKEISSKYCLDDSCNLPIFEAVCECFWSAERRINNLVKERKNMEVKHELPPS